MACIMPQMLREHYQVKNINCLFLDLSTGKSMREKGIRRQEGVMMQASYKSSV